MTLPKLLDMPDLRPHLGPACSVALCLHFQDGLSPEDVDTVTRRAGASLQTSWLFDAHIHEFFSPGRAALFPRNSTWLVTALTSPVFASGCGNAQKAVCERGAELGMLHLVDMCMSFAGPEIAGALTSFLEVAARFGRADIVRHLLRDPRTDPGAPSCGALWRAAENGYDDVVSLLLDDKRADPGKNDDVALCLAVVKGHEKVVALLLEDGRADPAARDNFALRMALEMDLDAIAEILLSDDRTGRSAWQALLYNGSFLGISSRTLSSI